MPRNRERVCLEDGLKLDLNILCCKGIVPCGPNEWQVTSWYPRYFGDVRSFCLLNWRLSNPSRGSVRLVMRALDQSIDLVAAPRHFGGAQWYFVCPVLGVRASVLWMPPGTSCFASRQAWGDKVAYGSQFETPPYRAMSRAKAIRSRLGDEQYTSVFFNPPPSKPKGMHWRTFGAQLERLEAYENKCDSYAEKLISRSRKA
jgi:hypothetical protein